MKNKRQIIGYKEGGAPIYVDSKNEVSFGESNTVDKLFSRKITEIIYNEQDNTTTIKAVGLKHNKEYTYVSKNVDNLIVDEYEVNIKVALLKYFLHDRVSRNTLNYLINDSVSREVNADELVHVYMSNKLSKQEKDYYFHRDAEGKDFYENYAITTKGTVIDYFKMNAVTEVLCAMYHIGFNTVNKIEWQLTLMIDKAHKLLNKVLEHQTKLGKSIDRTGKTYRYSKELSFARDTLYTPISKIKLTVII